jgi:hypothetical protein
MFQLWGKEKYGERKVLLRTERAGALVFILHIKTGRPKSLCAPVRGVGA